MENVTINTINVDKYRVNMEVYGNLFGKEVYSVKVSNADPKYNEKKSKGLPVPLTPIKLFTVIRHNIMGIKADVDGTGNPVVILQDQKGNDIRCNITKPEFKDVSVATVREAINAFESKEDTFFFSDCEKLTREVTTLNIQERSRANELAKEMAAQATLLSDTNEILKEQARRYYESLNQRDRGVDVEVNVSVNE